LQLQRSSLIKTVKKKVNSFQKRLTQQLHWTRQNFTCFHSSRF